MLSAFEEGVRAAGGKWRMVRPHELNIKPCTGCLRCNVLKRCSLSGDDWQGVADGIREADVLVFAAPVYFHHVPGPLKTLLDRFRSFLHVRITDTGLVHTPWEPWTKNLVLLLSMGSPDPGEAGPVVDLFRFMTEVMGKGNRLHTLLGTGLAMGGQVEKDQEELRLLYEKLSLPSDRAAGDAARNIDLLDAARALGSSLAQGQTS